MKNKNEPTEKELDGMIDHSIWFALKEKFNRNPFKLTHKEMRQMMFMPDGKTPRCQFCGHPMHNYTPKSGKFKGQLQHYSWVCDCPVFKKAGIVIGVG